MTTRYNVNDPVCTHTIACYAFLYLYTSTVCENNKRKKKFPKPGVDFIFIRRLQQNSPPANRARNNTYTHTYILFRSKSTEMQEKQQALGELDGKVQRTLTTAREYKLRPTKIQSTRKLCYSKDDRAMRAI